MTRPIRLDRRSRLVAALRRPDVRKRLGRATFWLGSVSLFSVGAVGALAIWHLVRRGRLIRGRQPPPRPVRLPEPEVRLPESSPT